VSTARRGSAVRRAIVRFATIAQAWGAWSGFFSTFNSRSPAFLALIPIVPSCELIDNIVRQRFSLPYGVGLLLLLPLPIFQTCSHSFESIFSFSHCSPNALFRLPDSSRNSIVLHSFDSYSTTTSVLQQWLSFQQNTWPVQDTSFSISFAASTSSPSLRSSLAA
jgi:hypothetical protein